MKSVHIERAREAAQKLLAVADRRTSPEYKEELLQEVQDMLPRILKAVQADVDYMDAWEDADDGTEE